MLYRLKRTLMAPWVLWQRHVYRDADPVGVRIMEVFAFSSGIKRFFAANDARDLLHGHDLDADSVVLDMGGFDGEWAEKIDQKYGCRLHIFEVLPGLHKKIRERFEGNPNVTLHPWGLLDRDTRQTVYLRGPGTTMYPDAPDRDAPMNSREVRMRDVNAVLAELGYDELDLVKINIEGGEYTVLPRMIEAGLHKRCRQIMIQYHEWIPGAYWQRWKITRALKKTHHRVWNYPFIWEKWQRRETP